MPLRGILLDDVHLPEHDPEEMFIFEYKIQHGYHYNPHYKISGIKYKFYNYFDGTETVIF